MATANYVLLDRVEVKLAVSTITISNIPQSGYTDLKVVLSARSTANGGQNVNLRFNGSATGYSDKIISGNGSATSSFTSGNTTVGGSCAIPGADFTANTFGNGEIYIPNYLSGTTKSFISDSVTEQNASTSYQQLETTTWTGTAAISSITFTIASGNFDVNSSIAIYGLAAVGTTPAIAPFATGGNVIVNDGTYWYHAFLANGTFTPQKTLSCDYLVVAGGGGSSSYQAQSGGGAGGLRYATNQSLPATNYAVIVGAGGAGGVGTAAYITGSTGGASSINSLEAAGGGGGSAASYTAGSGGSGGGSWSAGTAGTGNTPSTSPVQGYNGAVGSTDSSTYTNGGAGGGAGGAASAAVSTTRAANGGIGFYSSLTDAMGAATGTGVLSSTHYYYAGGGGGYAQSGSQGTGGTGGGGAGGGTNAGIVNTGGGAGGNGGAVNGNAGGSGIVIIRYAMV